MTSIGSALPVYTPPATTPPAPVVQAAPPPAAPVQVPIATTDDGVAAASQSNIRGAGVDTLV